MGHDDRPADHYLFLVVLGCALMPIGLAVIVSVSPVGILFVAAGLAMIAAAARRGQRRRRSTGSAG